MNLTQRIDFYSARIEQFQVELNALKQQKIQLGWLRLIVFSCIPISTVLLYPSVLAWLAGLFFGFVFISGRPIYGRGTENGICLTFDSCQRRGEASVEKRFFVFLLRQ
jgi:hypothetical protein